jgi:hypothetical protein
VGRRWGVSGNLVADGCREAPVPWRDNRPAKAFGSRAVGVGPLGPIEEEGKVSVNDKEHWKQDPDDHDYPAAASYLSLVLAEPALTAVVTALRGAPIGHWKAKDLLRASGLALLPEDNPHVGSDLKKINKGVSLSPVLLVRGDMARRAPLIIADGYHRICASYHVDEDADIPCRIAERPAG